MFNPIKFKSSNTADDYHRIHHNALQYVITQKSYTQEGLSIINEFINKSEQQLPTAKTKRINARHEINVLRFFLSSIQSYPEKEITANFPVIVPGKIGTTQQFLMDGINAIHTLTLNKKLDEKIKKEFDYTEGEQYAKFNAIIQSCFTPDFYKKFPKAKWIILQSNGESNIISASLRGVLIPEEGIDWFRKRLDIHFDLDFVFRITKKEKKYYTLTIKDLRTKENKSHHISKTKETSSMNYLPPPI